MKLDGSIRVGTCSLESYTAALTASNAPCNCGGGSACAVGEFCYPGATTCEQSARPASVLRNKTWESAAFNSYRFDGVEFQFKLCSCF